MANDSNKPDTSDLTPATESFEGIRNLRPDVAQKSFTDVGLLRPRANTGAPATPQSQPATSTPRASGTAPTTAAGNPTPKGK
ncbi:Uncharacterised protein [Burkholderia pseudomallei]|nr:Uncharacterised protein [Burkholderia pseudomallei]CAJ5703004.1 Uncharacterised protein [Burkholderia pseudomallei]CAJ7329276.1 Uncharacterised protein [Burkholderia pseudomallei]CAK1338000.1 Uncharacterised protein [Burkholderia pseudomallei]VBR58005.1 Uncharacterised protein [Burkholderia pseudomallei]